ncbi:YcnI family protein [Deinococcus lacus]|uniref:YcnI family protein n=1 Tax=Deinococcus lacus TaxID=392561 RepID=A0ABW1Y9N8_9DEIO
MKSRFFALLSAPALAHSTLQDTQAQAGSTYKGVLRVPHGCGEQATHTVRIQMPEGIYGVKPMSKPGWNLETVKGRYAQPYTSHGTVTTEGVREIVWSGGHLPGEWYDEFVFRGSLGADLKPGTVLHFPAVQECADATADWTDTSGDAGVKNPAPRVTIIAPAAAPVASPAAPHHH